ncbi:spatacsin [Marchantia polymorpha subsp. ruderalis]|uniref:Spatacsin C-terminal domain-containing protein n=2 Tax=Marchantia polymorpha TaxID=3197 RepID=A0AAF6B538_MARPO|nr:hypothetical protein MARPO_0066s0021 [Marchantia polymorpha]PTQ36062.1 hypothetical protein MARPO_0066s0021 [Marchantia polymorpha]BBN07122.1 hypothetical protein Mp_4g01220 [Marchantia polymorpha subsp. ruderalis]BBN07123.1 hypothetical protein Mp_4g01220 [Marchantia polymorpha subsp. ruderalis]|eukprot:PTQ36061.1 hypothetical protein MARPO_0066s0021 [Marchantia polymorpha]
MVEMDSEAEVEKEAPAVLQLHSWGNSPLPIAALTSAAISPSRQLLLLQSKDRDVVFLPLGASTAAQTASSLPPTTPDPPRRVLSFSSSSRNPTTPFATPATPIAAVGHSARTLSSPASVSTPYASPLGGTPPSSPRSAAFANISKLRGNPVPETPSTPYFTPSFNPLFTPPYGSGNGSSAPAKSCSAPPPTDLRALPYPILCDVDHFAWGCNGDGFGSEGPSGPFKEVLLTSGHDGLVFHCFSHTYRPDYGVVNSANIPASEVSSGQGGPKAKERKRREGKWRNWGQTEQDSRLELRRRLDETSDRTETSSEDKSSDEGVERSGSAELKLERGKRKQRPSVESTERGEDGEDNSRRDRSQSSDEKNEFVSYLVDKELEHSEDGLQLKYLGAQTWPSSALVVSFRIAKDTPAYSVLTSLKTRDEFVKSASSSEPAPDTKEEDRSKTSEKPVASDGNSGQQVHSEVQDVISSPSYNMLGIVAGQLLRASEMDMEDDEEVSEPVHARPVNQKNLKYRETRPLLISIALVMDWGIKWVARIDLNKRISKEACRIPWTSFTFARDRLLGLKEDGEVFVWGALTGSLVACIDVVDHCGLNPPSSLSLNRETAKGRNNEQTTNNREDITGQGNGGSKAGHEASRVDSQLTVVSTLRSKRKFTHIAVTANCLLLVVSDDKGLLFLVSTDSYFSEHASGLGDPSLNQKRYDSQNLRVMSYWKVGGSDIGVLVSSHELPDRHWLNSTKSDKDTAILGRGSNTQQRLRSEEQFARSMENGPGPPPRAISKATRSASGFSPRVQLARHGAANASVSAVKSTVRRVFLPCQRSESPVIVALSPYGVTALVRPLENKGDVFTITQNILRILGGAVDERDLYEKVRKKSGGRVEMRSSYVGDTLAFCSQGSMYLVTATSLHVVLPPLAVSWSQSAPLTLVPQEQEWPAINDSETQSRWDELNMGMNSRGTMLQRWQSEVLDRALVWDGLEEAEVLCLENGWSPRLLRLRRLQLALDFVRVEEIEQALEALVHVGAAESGVLYVLFAAVELMLNRHGSDNELAQASRLLSLAASFTTKLVRQHGMKGWDRGREQRQGTDFASKQLPAESSFEPSKYKTTIGLVELARFLEVIRNLQDRLEAKRRGPNRKKGDSAGGDGVYIPTDGRPNLDVIEEGNEEYLVSFPQEQGGVGEMKDMVTSFRADESISAQDSTLLGPSSSSALVATGGFVGPGGVWELSPPGADSLKGTRRSSPLESPSEMFARWEKDNVDAYGIVKDALKASGRLALAVAQLHRLRRKAENDGSEDRSSNSDDDVFAELLHIGRGIVYELLCKGKTGVALAALRRLGEDIDIALRELALGTLRRFLRGQVVKELQRLRCLTLNDFQLLERVSLTERIYPSSSFWSTYRTRQQLLRASPDSDERSSVNEEVELLLFLDMGADDGLTIKCGEVDGVVLGSWSMIDEPGILEVTQLQDSSSTGYWAAAAVWLQHWDQLTVDRILLEQPLLTGQLISWEARLEFNIAHHNWEEVATLLDTVPSYVLREGELHVQLDCDDSVSSAENLPFPGIPTYTGHAGQDWSDLDVEAVEAVVPKVHVLALDLTPICSTWMWQMIEERLVKNHIFLRAYWKGTLEIMSLFARAGLLYHRYGGRVSNSRSKDGSLHGTVSGPTKGSRLHKDAVRAIHELAVQHCVRHNLPHMLELYLDHHSLALDKGSASVMQALVGDCQWALWLLYSRLQRREYDASFANARTILAPSKSPGRHFEVSDLDVFLPTVDDMAEAGGEIMALSTLMFAPVPLQKCLCPGSVSRHSGPSWQCTLENLQPGLQRFPTLWRSLVVTCFGHDTRGSSSGSSLKAGSSGGLAQYLHWREGLFSSASGDTSLLQMMPRWLPQRVRRLLQLSVQGPAGGVQMAVQRGIEAPSRGTVSGEKGHAAELNMLESQVAAWEESIQKAIEEELYAPSTEDTGLGLEHHLRRGRALAAFNSLLGSRIQSGAFASHDAGSKVGHPPLTSSEMQSLLGPLSAHEEKLLATVAPLAIMQYENPVVVAACAFFCELCGLSANVLRLDVAALRRISEYCKVHDQIEPVPSGGGPGVTRETTNWVKAYGADMANLLAQALADEYLNAGVEMLSSKPEASRSRRPSQALVTVLQYLEKASLKDEGMRRVEGGSPGAWLHSGQGDGSQLRAMQRSMSERWSLVTAFCRAHHLPLSTTYLATLARDNDWVGFLSEAQLEGCPLDTLRTVVAKEFTDARLQSHLLTVLKSLPNPTSEKSTGTSSGSSSLGSPFTSAIPNMGMTGELFSLLAECEQSSKRAGKALLTKAKDLRWPLLAVVASCFSDATPLSCLTVWLEITAARETSAIQVSDAAAQISARVGAAVEATNALAGSSRTSGFRFSRTCAKRRRRMSPEEANAPLEGQQPQQEDVASTSSAAGSSSQPSQTGWNSSTIGQKGQTTGEGSSFVTDGAGEQESLAAMVAVLCEQQRFLPLLRAFDLFTPASSFLPFLRFLQAFSQMRISEASAHLAAFTALLKEETHQQHVPSRSAKSNSAWITKAAVAAADAMHAACTSAYERRCLLQLLSGSDFGDGGHAAMRFRRLYWKIQLAEPALREGSELVTDGTNLDDEGLLDALEKSGQWEQARSWARQLDLSSGGSSLHHVTETQAEAMVTEWRELLWDVPEERVALWNHCQALFTMHAFPALRAGKFFLKHADAVEAEVSSTELHNILLLALQWLSGSITNTSPVYPLHLLHELETRVWLLAVESSVETQDGRYSTSLVSMQSTPVGGLSHEICASNPAAVNPVDRTAVAVAVVDSHLKRSNLRKLDAEGLGRAQSLDTGTGSSPTKTASSKFKRRAKEQAQVKRIHLDISESTASDSEDSPGRARGERKNGSQEAVSDDLPPKAEDIVASWEERVGEREVERAVLALLEVGQVSAAKQLQQKLSPGHVPLELSLVEAALQVAGLSTPTTKGAVTTSIIQPTIVDYLKSEKLLEDLSSVTPMEVFKVLMSGCREGCGRGLIRRISAVAQIANFLVMPFNEAFSKQPTQLLQLLALKGQDALEEAKVLVSNHTMIPASIARILAESFLKGLLAAHRGGYMDSEQREEGPAPLLWRPSDFVRWAKVCPSEPEIGHALMRLVISGRDMPHACEVELIILAHQYYESSACLDGVDVLVALAATRVDSYVSEGDFSSLARLVTGISNFQSLRFILDLLIENGQLELLLKKRAVVDPALESSASVRGFRMAVLSALKHFNPLDQDAFAMVYSNFSMNFEMADLLESRGINLLEQCTQKPNGEADQTQEYLDIMKFFVEAARVYSGLEAGNKTRWCCAQAQLISLQLRLPEIDWLKRNDTAARCLLVDRPRFQEALIVAEAYSLNQSAEWVLVIWNQMLVPGRIDQFLNDFIAALPLTHNMLLEISRFYRSELTARGGDQASSSRWLAPGGVPLELAMYMKKSFRSLLKHTRDVKDRLQLATFATGFSEVVDACMRTLDIMPATAGPLILRKGHGGAYLPIM